MNLTRLLAMSRKEAIQLRRDPRSLAMAFLLPVALIVFFGYAISFDVKNIEMAVLDESNTESSRSLVRSFASSGYFDIREYPASYSEVGRLLQLGKVKIALVIPPGFYPDLTAGRGAQVQILLDGSDANTASIAQNYAAAIATRFSTDVVLKGRRVVLPVEAESRVWYNETLESRNMIVPGLVAVIMSIIAAMLTALTIAREWERGTMEQLAATPVHRLEVVIGKLLPYVAIGLFDVALAIIAGRVIFDVPLRGNLLLLSGLTFLFLLGALCFGMFISAAVKTQVLATQVALQTTYLPAILLSGFMFSISTMPVALQAVTYVVPARYYVTVTKGIFRSGRSWREDFQAARQRAAQEGAAADVPRSEDEADALHRADHPAGRLRLRGQHRHQEHVDLRHRPRCQRRFSRADRGHRIHRLLPHRRSFRPARRPRPRPRLRRCDRRDRDTGRLRP
jgi:ABC-2 type transport system permease protein